MNQHHREAERLSTESSLDNEWPARNRLIIAAHGQVEATLALAYAQDTANLIAALGAIYSTGQPVFGLDEDTIATQIRERLGLA